MTAATKPERYQIQLRRWDSAETWNWSIVDYWSGGWDVDHGTGFCSATDAARDAESRLEIRKARELLADRKPRKAKAGTP